MWLAGSRVEPWVWLFGNNSASPAEKKPAEFVFWCVVERYLPGIRVRLGCDDALPVVATWEL
jgi:hypothetical protein